MPNRSPRNTLFLVQKNERIGSGTAMKVVKCLLGRREYRKKRSAPRQGGRFLHHDHQLAQASSATCPPDQFHLILFRYVRLAGNHRCRLFHFCALANTSALPHMHACMCTVHQMDDK